MSAVLRRLPMPETALLVVATLVLIAAAALRGGERSGRATLDAFSTYDAQPGGYRAFYELLEREGVRVERFVRRPAFLDASLDTLAWVEPPASDTQRPRTTAADAAALEAWVRAGGRLLFIGDDSAARNGVVQLPASRRTAVARGALAVAPELRAAGVARVRSDEPRRWQPAPQRDARELVYDRAGALVVLYSLGRGRVVAVLDRKLFTNENIARDDYARFAYALARPRGRGGSVAFDEALHGFAVPEHWWGLVSRPFAVALALAGCALLIGFGGAALRLGPPLQPVARTDRSSADFIDAVAALLERGGASTTALQDAVHSTTRVLARALGAGEGAASGDVAARLEAAGARADFADMLVIARHAKPSEAEFIRGVALAQRLRKEFTAHAHRN